jgi:hypothetical protein
MLLLLRIAPHHLPSRRGRELPFGAVRMNATFNTTRPPAQLFWAPAQIDLGTYGIPSISDLPKYTYPTPPPKGGCG